MSSSIDSPSFINLKVTHFPFVTEDAGTETVAFDTHVDREKRLYTFADGAYTASTNSLNDGGEITVTPDGMGSGTQVEISHLVAHDGKRYWIEVSTILQLREPTKIPGKLSAVPGPGVESLPAAVKRHKQDISHATITIGKDGEEHKHIFLRVYTAPGNSKFVVRWPADSEVDVLSTFTVGLYSGLEAERISNILRPCKKRDP